MNGVESISIENQPNNNSKQWPQYLAVFLASICSYSGGLHYAWSSPSVPKLLEVDYPLNITAEEASNVIVIYPIGTLLGPLLMAYVVDIIGPKYGLLLIALPTFVAWMIIAFAQNVAMLYIGRFIAGTGDGFLGIVYPMYLGEITDPNVRGVLGCSFPVTTIVAMISMNSYAPYLSIRDTVLIASIVPVIMVITFVWMPESPYFYLMKGQYEEAKKSLRFLKRCDIENDFQQLKKDVERQMSERGTWKDLLCIQSNRRALLIGLGARSVQQFSGISAWDVYTQTIFNQAGGNISPILATLIYLFIQLIMISSGSFLLEKYGRKPLFIISSVATSIILFVGGTFFYLKEMTDIDTSSFSWSPVLVMICFTIMYSIGLGNVLLSELFSASIKGKALCIACMYSAACISVTSKLFYILTENFGMYASFFTFGCLLLISVAFSYYFMLETKGKTLEDIQQHFKGNNLNEIKK